MVGRGGEGRRREGKGGGGAPLLSFPLLLQFLSTNSLWIDVICFTQYGVVNLNMQTGEPLNEIVFDVY